MLLEYWTGQKEGLFAMIAAAAAAAVVAVVVVVAMV